MHRDLKELLHHATGESRFVVAIFLDVRGFSSFAKIAESSESAVYLKRVYVRILDEFFEDASFFKPTGDGLLIILDYDEATLADVVTKAVKTSIELVDAFPHLADDDPMVNFEVPQLLGVGIARGAATRLAAGDKVLDYSGRPLNLAARLMDLARPLGVVFDSTLGLDLLDGETAALFTSEEVYVKGLAEHEPMTAHVLADRTVVPDFNRKPINRFERHVEETEILTFADLKDRQDYLHPLTRQAANDGAPTVYLRVPKTKSDGSRHPTIRTTYDFSATMYHQGGEPYARLDYDHLAVPQLTAHGAKDAWPVEVWVEYDALPE